MWIFNPDFSLLLGKGGALQAAEKRCHAVILSAAKAPRSSRGAVNRANYGGSSPKMRAQNDSATNFSATSIAAPSRGLPDYYRFPLVPLALGLLLAVFVLMFSAGGMAATLGLYRVMEIKPKVFVWIPDDVINQECDPLFTRPATAGFIVTSQGVVMVDTSNSPMNARDLLYEIRQRTDIPIRFVINTSSAPDHMLGNEVFTDEQATLISTKTAQAEMQRYRQDLFDRMRGEEGWKLQARMRGFHVTPSTQTFDGEMKLNMGGQEIRMASLLHSGVSPEDAIVYLPSAKTLFLGELFDNQYFPRIGSRDVHHWIEVLRQVEGWDVDTYVPGHGAPGSKKDLADFRKFLEWIVAQVEMRLKQGKTPEDVQKALWLPKTYNWHAPDLASDTVADICRQLAPPAAPPAPSKPEGQ
jgi:glyoxylase-like metal-dependent hydrolase (beta-lactamase superfamily II)